MTRPLNLRRALLAAVDAFLEASPPSLAKAHRLVARCYAARRFVSLNEIVWGGIIVALTDFEHYENVHHLREYRNLLAAGSSEIHRAYLNHDCSADFTAEERIWHEQLAELLDFLQDFPFPDAEAATKSYEQRVVRIGQSVLLSPPPSQLGEEMIYHLILRDVSAVLTTLDLRLSLLLGRLVPAAPLTAFPPQTNDWRERMPDASGSLDWA